MSLTTGKRARAFTRLGKYLASYVSRAEMNPEDWPESEPGDVILTQAVRQTMRNNPWFIRKDVLLSLEAIAFSLEEEKVLTFTQRFVPDPGTRQREVNVGVVMAGNVPLVGFHDFFCVILSGHRFIGKLSTDDRFLLPALAQLMVHWHPDLKTLIRFAGARLTGFEAVIATGSDNTSRYFEYYFSKYPHIIRRNRNSAAVLNGGETAVELQALGMDIFSYFGRGCRSVSKLFLPQNYDPASLFPHWTGFEYMLDHHKYRNNFDYYRSVYLVNQFFFHDNGPVLIIENHSFSSPVAVLYYEFYRDIDQVIDTIKLHNDRIQCVVSSDPAIGERISFGTAQKPSLFEFADGINTMEFLTQLHAG